MFYPNYEEVNELAKKFNVIPISMQVYADMETSISLFKRFGGQDTFLLESVEGGEKWARYSFIGRKPYINIISTNGITEVRKDNQTSVAEGNPLEVLQGIMKSYKAPNLKGVPRFSGGAVGYLGYDIVRYYEKISNTKDNDTGIPEFHYMITDEILACDHFSQKIHIIVNLHVNEHLEREYVSVTQRIKEIYAEIKASRTKLEAERKEPIKEEIELRNNTTAQEYCAGVETAKEHIRRKTRTFCLEVFL